MERDLVMRSRVISLTGRGTKKVVGHSGGTKEVVGHMM